MRFFNGKYYEDNKLSLLSALLYNLKWLGVFIILINIVPVLESSSVYGLDDEVAFWGVLLFAGTLCLFVFKKKWQSFCDMITDKLAK